ncbi:MAG: hypothetical protein H6741_00085 [Alphaproteobacteria bacterium]|nr:hypothetical protein [Alphaproteobacteria bacterium]MCB9791102.1 hypothetical protein [Alphaproteobacteria bacterium]
MLHDDPPVAQALAARGPLEIEHLRLDGARDLTALVACRNLKTLELRGGAPEGLDMLASLPALRRLRLRFCALPDVAPLARCAGLEELDLSFSDPEDAGPLLGRLPRLVLDGLPLTAEAREAAAAASTPGHRVRRSAEPDWRLARRLWEAGTGLTFGLYAGRPLLVRPGPGSQPGRVCDHIAGVRASLVSRAMRATARSPRMTLPKVRWLAERPLGTDPDDGNPLDVGDARDARAWVAASNLPVPWREALGRLLDGFPTLWWARKRQGGAAEAGLPAWWTALEATLSHPEPQGASWVCFDGPATARYALGPSPWVVQGLPALSEHPGLVPVGERVDGARAALLIEADRPQGGAVFELSDGAPLRQRFGSWPELLDRIGVITNEDGERFERLAGAER